jgi:hypothetical protein
VLDRKRHTFKEGSPYCDGTYIVLQRSSWVDRAAVCLPVCSHSYSSLICSIVVAQGLAEFLQQLSQQRFDASRDPMLSLPCNSCLFVFVAAGPSHVSSYAILAHADAKTRA